MFLLNLAQFSEHPIIDLRLAKDFSLMHIQAASNFPILELESRIYELPVRSVTINLFGEPEVLKTAANLLTKAGYLIAEQCESTPDILQQIKNSSYAVIGSQSKRLWQPAPIVESFCKKISPSVNAKGLDIACGSGRDSVYLSENGWAMTSIDYSSSSLEKLQQLAGREQQEIITLLIDLEKNFADLAGFKQQFELVVVVRYLHRATLKQLKALLKPGGYIVYQTFMQGCEKFGSPKNPRFLLKANELAEVFSDFNIILDKVEYLTDGRPTNCFIAQKEPL